MKSWVDNSTYCTYMSASSAETNEPLRIDNKQRFIQKEYKSPDALMSILHILDLKTQRAQAEADMFFEAIEHTAEIEFTDDGGLAALFQVYHAQMTIGLSLGSGTTTTRLPDD